MTKYQAIRGMNDLLPEQTPVWQLIETKLKALALQYGYSEIRFPVVESFNLFKRTIGEVTDIVEKEMYAFADRNGDWLALRPEGTAGCVRASIEHGLLYNQQQKLWYLGPMFRHERPQKGRCRQFHQFGMEAFGYSGPDIDVDLILFTARLWRELGLQNHLELQINSLGSTEARAAYRQQLIHYYEEHISKLDEDSLRRLYTNPLRILDSKNPAMHAVNNHAPKLQDYLDAASAEHFEGFCQLLDAAGVTYIINPCLVRGLDYYNGTVFEWVTSSLGAQGTVCAGGRYDGLVEQLGGKPTQAIGLGIGLERLALLVEEFSLLPPAKTVDIYLITLGKEAQCWGVQVVEQLRDQFPQLMILPNMGEGSVKTQMKRADKSGAVLALIIGENEIKQQTITVKPLRDAAASPQQVRVADLPQIILKAFEF